MLRQIVETNSSTDNAEGLEKVRELLMPHFTRLGFEGKTQVLNDGHKLVVYELPGATPELMLVGHIDTVFPKATPGQTFAVKGDRIEGPGVIDMKGGLVAMLEVLERLSTKDRARIRVAINDDEEVGSPFSKAPLDDLARGLKTALVFEPGLPGGALVTGHAGVYWLKLSITGRAAHAGLEPEKGINACVELAREITELAALTDYDKHLTVNPGVIDGGTKPNVVCESASAQIDIRFARQQDADQVLARLEVIRKNPAVKSRATGEGPTSHVEVLMKLTAMGEELASEPFAAARAAGRLVGQDVRGQRVGYGSDANHLAETGIHILVGVGPYGGGMHTANEMMSVQGYLDRVKLDVQIVRALLK